MTFKWTVSRKIAICTEGGTLAEGDLCRNDGIPKGLLENTSVCRENGCHRGSQAWPMISTACQEVFGLNFLSITSTSSTCTLVNASQIRFCSIEKQKASLSICGLTCCRDEFFQSTRRLRN